MEDMADSNRYAMYVSGGSMGLGDRDYYLNNDKETLKIRNAYKSLSSTRWSTPASRRKTQSASWRTS